MEVLRLKSKRTHSKATLPYALVTLCTVFAVILLSKAFFNANVTAMFFFCWPVALLFCLRLGYTILEMEEAALDYCRRVLRTAFIAMAVGAMIALWISAGTVPTIIYYGLKLLSPKFFLLSTFLLSVVVSTVTGTSLGTVGTVGLSMMAIAGGLGMNLGLTAGFCLSGALFGDWCSPVSDSPNTCSAAFGEPLVPLCKHIFKLAIPAAAIVAVVAFALGITTDGAGVDLSNVAPIMEGLKANFKINLITLLPMVLLLVLLAKNIPAITSILTAGLTGGLVAALYQGVGISKILTFFWSGYTIDSGMEFLDKILNRGGVTSMWSTVGLMLFTFSLFGMFDKVGIMDAVIGALSTRIKSVTAGVLTTLLASGLFGFLSGTMSVPYVVSGTLMAPVAKDLGTSPKNFARVSGIGATLCNILIPWGSSTVLFSPLLGVGLSEYWPYVFIAWAAIGLAVVYAIFKIDMPQYMPEEDAATPKKEPQPASAE